MSTGTESRTVCSITAVVTLFAMSHALVGCSSDSSAPGGGPPADAAISGNGDASVDSMGNVSDASVPDASADASVPDAAAEAPAPDAAGDVAAPLTCSPSTLLDPRPWEECPGDGYCVCRSYAPDAGGLAFDYGVTIMDITSMQLTDVMKAGQPYSLSVSVSNSGFYGDIEFWGTTSECGPGLQKLYSAPVESKVYCADVLPTQDYTYVLYVQRLMVDSGAPAGEHADTILACPTGRCPKVP
jgi:hypothetical protein